MASDSVEALCGKCHVRLEPVAHDDGEEWLACPRCGANDSREAVFREVSQHLVEVVSRGSQKAIGRAARRHKIAKFTGKPIPKRKYRFIGNLES
ncbi:hypothetical protein ACUN0C_10250 [Faunimonas sp. B44]